MRVARTIEPSPDYCGGVGFGGNGDRRSANRRSGLGVRFTFRPSMIVIGRLRIVRTVSILTLMSDRIACALLTEFGTKAEST